MTLEKDKIQEAYESNILINESRGGWMKGLIYDLEEAFNSDAGMIDGKYSPASQMQAGLYLSEKDHKALIKALENLVKTMQKAYKGKLIGW